VGQFGEKLRRERELRGITLEEVAIATKIGTRSLRALEEEKFSELPGGVFNKGFVRAYARYVGIDEEQAVSDYLTANKESVSSDEVNIHLIARQFEASHAAAQGDRRQGAAAFVWSLVAVFAIVSASVAGWPYLQKRLADRAETRRQQLHADSITARQASLPQPVQAASTAPPASQANTAQSAGASVPPVNFADTQNSPPPVAGGDSRQRPAAPVVAAQPGPAPVDAAGQKEPAAKGISLVLTARQRCWVSIRVDGKRVMEDTLDPESSDKRERSFQARERLVVEAGNPAGLEVTLNGQSLGRIGPTGSRRTITFTPEGIER
jgi:cytoskeleton protein RodZ